MFVDLHANTLPKAMDSYVEVGFEWENVYEATNFRSVERNIK